MSLTVTVQNVHPLTLYSIQKIVIILLLAFTPPTSLLRFAPLPVLLTMSLFMLPYYTVHIKESPDILWASGEILMGHLEYLEKLLLSQWSFDDQGPSAEIRRHDKLNDQIKQGSLSSDIVNDGNLNHSTTKHTKPSLHDVYSRLKFALWAGTSNRYIATPSQAPHTPPYSTSSPSYIPSRTIFLLRKVLIIFSCILLLDLIALSGLIPKDTSLFTEENTRLFPRVSEVSGRWVVTRMRGTAGLWLGNFAGMQIYYSFLTSIGVALGMTSPAERRPVFGSIAEAYSIRGYFG